MLYAAFDELVALKQKSRFLPFASGKLATSSSSGNYLSPVKGQGLEFEEVRAYAPGDDIRTIDWRVTARTGTPHTKVFREDRERSVVVYVDVNASMRFGTRGTFKSVQAARIAALLGWQANLNHDKLGSCVFGDIPHGIQISSPQRSRKPLWNLFKLLTLQDINENAPSINLDNTLIHTISIIPTGALVYIISDFSDINESLEKQLRALRKRCKIVLIAIDDPADQNIPSLGSVVFTAQERQLYINTNNEKGRETYAQQWQKIRQSLEKMAKKLGIEILCIATDADASSELFFGLNRIRKRKRVR